MPMNKIRLKKGDTVKVLSGKDRGKNGKIIEVRPEQLRIVVEGINIHKKFQKAAQGKPGTSVSFPAALASGKVMLVCPNCSKPTRLETKILENGEKQRICKLCKKGV